METSVDSDEVKAEANEAKSSDAEPETEAVSEGETESLIPAEEGGDDYYLNGGYVKLRDAGKFAQAKQAAVEQNQPKDEPENHPKERKCS